MGTKIKGWNPTSGMIQSARTEFERSLSEQILNAFKDSKVQDILKTWGHSAGKTLKELKELKESVTAKLNSEQDKVRGILEQLKLLEDLPGDTLEGLKQSVTTKIEDMQQKVTEVQGILKQLKDLPGKTNETLEHLKQSVTSKIEDLRSSVAENIKTMANDPVLKALVKEVVANKLAESLHIDKSTAEKAIDVAVTVLMEKLNGGRRLLSSRRRALMKR